MEELLALMGRNGLLPHGVCFSWSPGLLWGMLAADLTIALAYFSIPLVIATFVRRRGALTHRWVPWVFSAFIFACGLTHLASVWTVWVPDYPVQLVLKIITAAISLFAAAALWPLLPRALRIPSVAQLQQAVSSLEAEVARRRSAEDSLHDTAQSLAVTLGSIGAGFIATDAQGRITRMNAAAEALTGWPQDEARGQPLWQVFCRDDLSPADVARNPVELHGDPARALSHRTRVTLLDRAGRPVPVQVHGELTRSADGRVLGLALVVRDLRAEQHAHNELQRLAAIVSSSNDAIIGITLTGIITSWNRAAETMFGYRADEALGRPVQMLLPPEREDEEMRILASLTHGSVVPPFDTVRVSRDGRRIEVSITASPIRDVEGHIVGASKIARDVSLQHRLEAARHESDERLRFALEAAQIGDWVLDVDSGQLTHSARFDRCFGSASLPAHWDFNDWLQAVHPDDRAAVAQGLHDSLTQWRDWHGEFRVSWPDGSTHWLAAHGSLTGASGGARRLVGIVSDLTGAKLAEAARLRAQQLEAENRQIQEANRLKSQFLANMSHELRTPLNAVIGFSELLRSGAVPDDSPKRGEFLGHIAASGRHLLQLINDVLDLSKVESGKLEFFPEAVDLAQLVDEVGGVLQSGLRSKGLTLAVDIAPEVRLLVLDGPRLKQVLYNYLSNAIKFTPQGGHIALRALSEGADAVRIEVEDTGIGIAREDLPRLFVEFQQLDAGFDKRHAGTGLGLALTRRLVEAQGGRVGVRSQLGQGSVFHLVLPRKPLASVPAPAAPPKLLVVENDAVWRARLATRLQHGGLVADEAATAGEAVARAGREAYQGLMLNLVLPDQHGLQALADIRRTGSASQGSPVLAMSMPVTPGEAATFGIADVLSKPLRTDEVAAVMARLRVDGRAARVLVVDDDALARQLMQATLGSLGFDAVCVAGGREALGQLETLRPDALVLDLMMPGFDGFATLDALRAQPDWQALPVFIWTSLLLNDEELRLLSGSAQAVLAKGDPALTALLAWLASPRALAGTAAP